MALGYAVRYAGERVNDLADRAILGGSCRLEAGAFGSLTVELPPSHPMARLDAFAKRDASREFTLSETAADGTEAELFRGWVTGTRLDTDLNLTVECEGQLSYLTGTVVRPWSPTALTGLSEGTVIVNGDPLEWLVDQHDLHCDAASAFTVGHNPRARVASGSDDWKTTWDELQEKFCTGLDRFLNARSDPWGRRVLDLLDGGAGEGTQAVVVGENVVEMSLDESSREVVTAIVPRGQTDDEYQSGAGERIDRRDIGCEGADVGPMVGRCSTCVVDGDRVVNREMAAVYGIREERRDYDAATAEDLARAAARDLDPAEIGEAAVRSFDIQAVDLHMLNPEVQPIRLLDWVEVFIRADGQTAGDARGRLIFHGWLPCTAIDIDLGDPTRSRYHFGDLEETLTRKSALRLGMLRRGTGTLVRRAGAVPWNNDRVWNRSNAVWDHADEGDEALRQELQDTSDRWAEHLDEQFDVHTQQWYESLDEAKREDAQGREELLKQLDEAEGRWVDGIGAIGDEVDGLASTVDSNHRELLDGIRGVAESAQRTFFGICQSGGATRSVPSNSLTRPGGEEFTLAKGAVVDVLMERSWAGACTLDVAGTGVRSVFTNGDPWGVWQENQVVRFLYDGTCWQSCSTDIYGRNLLIGNPAALNFAVDDGQSVDLNIGDESYWHVGVTGQTVGLATQSHIDIGSSTVTFANQRGTNLEISRGTTASARISDTGGVVVDGGNGFASVQSSYGSLSVATDGSASLTSTAGPKTVSFSANRAGYATNGVPWVARSIVISCTGANFAYLSPTHLGIGDAAGYAFAISNGDQSANNCAVVGSSYRPATRGLTVTFDREVSGSLRLNVLGFPVSTLYQSNDPGLEGPETFGDPEAGEPEDTDTEEVA